MSRPRLARYAGLLGVVLVALVLVISLLAKSNDATPIPPGHMLPPFAVPLEKRESAGCAASVAL